MKTCLAFSGGIDSTALLLRLIELGDRPSRILFADTMFNYPEMHAYIRKVEKHISQTIWKVPIWKRISFFKHFLKVKHEGKYAGAIYGLPTKSNPWIAYEKYRALYKATKTYDKVYIGLNMQEKPASEKPMFAQKNFRYPLIKWGWNHNDCLKYLQTKDMVNPILEIYGKVWSCWLCPRQSFHTLQVLKIRHPELFNILKMLNDINPHTKAFRLDHTKQKQLLEKHVIQGT